MDKKVAVCVQFGCLTAIKSASYPLISDEFRDKGATLADLLSVNTFQLIISYQDTAGLKCADESFKKKHPFPSYYQDVQKGQVSSTVHPLVYWNVDVNLFAYGTGISLGRSGENPLKVVTYCSKLGMRIFMDSVKTIKGYENGRLSIWIRVPLGEEPLQLLTDESVLLMVARNDCDAFVALHHAPYSAITPLAVFSQFSNVSELCAHWQQTSAIDIFEAVTSRPAPSFVPAIKAFLLEQSSKERWKRAIDTGFNYLQLIQGVFQSLPHGQDYSENQRRSIADPVILIASAYADASVDLEIELWSPQEVFPDNVIGHGPIDYLSSKPGREGSTAMGKKRVYSEAAMVPTVVAMDEATAMDEPAEDIGAQAEETMLITEQKTRKTVSSALLQLLSQTHDSMLSGSGQLEKYLVPGTEAKPIAKRRFCVLSTGQRYYFFLVQWPDPASKPSIHYLGMLNLPFFPPLDGVTARESCAAVRNGVLDGVNREQYELIVAAVVVCLHEAFYLQ